MGFFELLGSKTIGLFHQLGAVILLLNSSCKELNHLRFRETIKQCLDLGVLSFPIVALTLLFTGMVLSVQIAGELTKYGAGFTVGAIVAIGMGRELGPVLCGVVLAGRVSRLMLFDAWRSALSAILSFHGYSHVWRCCRF